MMVLPANHLVGLSEGTSVKILRIMGGLCDALAAPLLEIRPRVLLSPWQEY